ncbi:energy-coupling factor transporter ATPase [Microbacterium betulae]|uniref:Energy-coupling factor transporter ATPase n=1 Tax=Microbacterium betulae TaxID=2981139 RepID=A0AA97FGW7_9MICO|nr:energy-coupling factor transporter ATPase [Microbacterium sp. AB]WOF22678.1 energy-coupling factor transporter ATPase [Microbacterium sp. AB]
MTSDKTLLLRVSGVGVTHVGSDRPAPADVSFDVHAGEVVLVLGPSGSGKSTLTLTLDGLIPHAVDADLDGTVEVGGIDTRASTPAELSTRVGMVFQDPDAQIVTGSVLDEVAFALENLLLPVDEVLSRGEAALRRMGLWERRDDDPDALSGGGRQRLAIACALATGSPVLVLDEPTANLDPVGIDDVYAALRDVVAGGDRAVVLVEHNLDTAVALATRVVVIDGDGRLAFDGPARAVLRDEVDTLERLGVWLPSTLLAARRLRAAGWRMDPLPLTPDELASALGAQPTAAGRGADDAADDAAPSPGTPPASGSGSGSGEGEAPAGQHGIRVRGLTVRRLRRALVHDIDLDLPGGSFTAVVGTNGAGKTTLVQAVAGVVAPPRGSVVIDGIDIGRASPREIAAHVGFVFQNPEHQFVAHTVFDELAHGLRIRRTPEGEVRERVDAMLDRFGLAHHAETHPFRLSGGQKRRLSVGTALITGPRVLVLDEPVFGQDRARAEELLALLRELHAEGTTIVIVTHDLSLAARHATHVAVMADGALARFAPAGEVFSDAPLLERSGLRLPALQRVLAAHPAASAAIAAAQTEVAA